MSKSTTSLLNEKQIVTRVMDTQPLILNVRMRARRKGQYFGYCQKFQVLRLERQNTCIDDF